MTEREELAKFVGKENVLDDPETLERYSRDESFVHPIRPLCVAKPGTLAEVESIVNWANSTRTPLVPVSSGAPRFHGDTIPSVGGAVIIDMTRMKKIVRVDRRNRVAMVEPGVTFGELIPELAREDLAPLMPLVPRQSKSVVASLLEREPITMPRYHWETQDPLRCAEVVYGSGDLFRTGSAAGPGTLEEQWEVGRAQVRPMGPSFVDFAKLIQGGQGTMGIVTWVTVACRPLPKLKRTFLIPADNIDPLIDLTYKLLWKKLGQDCFIVNNQDFASLLTENGQQVEALRNNLSPWILVFSIEGFGVLPNERVEYQEAEFMDVAQSFGFEPATGLAGVTAKQVAVVLSKPSKEPYWKLRAKGGCHDIFFLTTLDKTPEFIEQMCNLAYSYRYSATDIGIYLQPTVQGTNCHCEFSLSYDPKNQQEMDRIRKLDSEAARVLANMGAFFSRPYGPWTDIAYGNAAKTIAVQSKVKDIFDPNGIMNPGKLYY